MSEGKYRGVNYPPGKKNAGKTEEDLQLQAIAEFQARQNGKEATQSVPATLESSLSEVALVSDETGPAEEIVLNQREQNKLIKAILTDESALGDEDEAAVSLEERDRVVKLLLEDPDATDERILTMISSVADEGKRREYYNQFYLLLDEAGKSMPEEGTPEVESEPKADITDSPTFIELASEREARRRKEEVGGILFESEGEGIYDKPTSEISAEAPIVPNPEDAPIDIVEGLDDATAAENRGKFREVMARAAEMFGWYKSSDEHFIRRRAELDAQAEKVPGMERLFRKWGESYNKMPLKYKLLMGGALGLGSAATAGTLLMALPLLGIGAQRVLGLSTMYLKFEKKSHDEAWGRNKEWGKQKALLKAGIYTALLGLTMKEAIEQLGETDMAHAAQAKVSGWLGSVFGHATETTTPANVPSEAAPPAVEQVVEKPIIGQQSDVAVVRAMDNQMMQPEAAPLVSAEVSESAPSAEAEIAAETPPEATETMLEELGTTENSTVPETASGETVDQLSGPTETAPETVPSGVVEQLSGPEESPAEVSDGSLIIEGQNPDIDDETRQRALKSVAPEMNPLTGLVDEQPPAPVETLIPRPVYPMDVEIQQPVEPPQVDVIRNPEIPAVSVDTSVPQPETGTTFEVDPTRGQIFQTTDGAIVASGDNYELRFNAAQEYAKAHPGTSVWVQADKPVLDSATNTLRPWIQELKWEPGFLGFGGGMKVLNPIGPTSSDQIGGIMPKSFKTLLVK